MSDQVDSSVANEDKSAPQADLSQKQSDETQSGNLPAGSALAELALKDPEAAEQLRRQFQSQKDKGVAEAVKTAKQVRDDLEAFAKAMNIDLSKVTEYRRNKILDEMYEQQYGNSQPEPGGEQAVEAQRTASSVDIKAIKAAYAELDWNDDAALEAISKYAYDQKGLLAALGEIKVRQASKPKASPTEAMLPGGGKPVSVDEKSALQSSYTERVAALKQEYRGALPPNVLDALKREYRKKGLDVW